MVHTFATHEEAAIFASAMRSEGYFAEILDGAMGTIYGPLTIGGIRVIVSDGPVGNDDGSGETDATMPPPAGKPHDGEFLTILRMLVVSVAALGVVILVVLSLSAYSGNPGGLVWALLAALKYPLMFGLVLAIMGPFMGSFTRFVRGESLSEGWGILRWLLLALLVPFLLLALL